MIDNRVKTGNLVSRLCVVNGAIAAKFSKIADGITKSTLKESGSEVSKLALGALKNLGAFFVRLAGLALTGMAYLLEGAVALALSPIILGVVAYRNRDTIEKVALRVKDFIESNATIVKQGVVNISNDLSRALKYVKVATSDYAKSSINTLKSAGKSLSARVSAISKQVKNRGGLGKVIKSLATTGYLPVNRSSHRMNISAPES